MFYFTVGNTISKYETLPTGLCGMAVVTAKNKGFLNIKKIKINIDINVTAKKKGFLNIKGFYERITQLQKNI